MTEVSFYTGVPERLAYLGRLLRKAYLSGARVGIVGPQRLLSRLDASLWTLDPLDFIPHLMLDAPATGERLALAERTPLLLVEDARWLPHREMLLNLDSEIPEAALEFQRVLEVVSTEPEQVAAGRSRFKHYKSLGCEVKHHVIGAGG